MITLLNNRVRKRYEDYARSSLQKIAVNPGLCRYNFRCFSNAVHDAIQDKQKAVAMVIYMHNQYPIVHFLNLSRGKYTDNTLGLWSQRYDYYLVRIIQEDEFWSIEPIFENYKKVLAMQLLPWYIRMLSDYRG